MKSLTLSSWLKTKLLAVDIETRTRALPHYPQIVHGIKQFGLSALAPITHVSLYHPELGSWVFDLQGYDPYTGELDSQSREAWEAIQQILCRKDLLIIGHNVLFDLRGIGVQYNKLFDTPEFYLPLGAKVWDTEIIAKRMLIGETFSKHSAFRDDFDLLSLANRLEIEIDSKLLDMVAWMKAQRANLSELASSLASLAPQDSLWAYLKGYIPPNRPDLLQKAAQDLLHDYVAFDAQIAYRMYEKELAIAEALAEGDVSLGHYKLSKYPELTQRDIHPAFESHLDYWTRYLRIAANRTIKGLRVNLKHLRNEQEKAQKIRRDNERLLAQSRDPHDPYEAFEEVIGQLFYHEMLLKKLAELTKQSSKKSTFSKNIEEEWYFWQALTLSPYVLEDALSFEANTPPEEKQAWFDFLSNAVYATIQEARKAAPQSRVPEMDLADWVKRNCYQAYSEPQASLLAKCKLDWFREYFTTRRSDLKAAARKYYDSHPSKTKTEETKILADGERLFREKMTNSKKWIPYYLFCVSGAPLPSSYDFRYQEGLVTGAAKQALEAYRETHNGEEPEDLRDFYVARHLQAQSLSYGKNALAFYLSNEDYVERSQQLSPLRELLQARADLNRLREFQQHAALDGRVHSLLRPDAKTGRNKSSNPNLQNIKMKMGTPYPGLFIAPKGYWFNSADYSNAEVRLGNLLGKDDTGAAAAEDNDYHAVMAAEFWPDVFPQLKGQERKIWRNFSKRITFGSNYGSGKVKIALMLRCSLEKAKEVLDNKKRALFRTEEQKKHIQDNARKRMNAGYLPVFVALWSKERVQVDRLSKLGRVVDIVGYPTWNYVVQGGITAMIRRADVLMTEMLERENAKTFIQMDIHDELLFAVHLEEYQSDLLPRCLEIMNSIMPEEYCERTTPKTHFIAEFGPENSRKWGYRSDRPYPWPLDHFISQWGHQPLPDDILAKPEEEREAPTWIGPKHLGWTLEAETEALIAKRRMQLAIDQSKDEGSASLSSGNHWLDLQLILSQETQNRAILELLQPKQLIFVADNGRLQNSGLLTFSAWMTGIHALYHRGKSSAYCEALAQIKSLLETSELPGAKDWLQNNESLFKLVTHA